MPLQTPKHNMAYVMAICAVAALGGLLFGYDSSVISGAIEPITHHYQLSPAETGWTFYSGMTGVISVLGLFGFMFLFGGTWGQVVWTAIGEIFPTRLRGAGMGFSICAMWAGNFFVSQSFPMMNQSAYLNDNFHGGFPLLLFAVCSLASWWFVKALLPETKGVSLEKMEALILERFETTQRESKTVTH